MVRAPRIPAPGETLLGSAYDEYAGGKGLNQAVAAARSGATVAFIGAVGDDDAGRRLRAVATADGIDTEGTPTIGATPTGRALITVSEDGENSIVVVPGANALVHCNTVPLASVVLAQLEVPLSTVVAAFRAGRDQGAITILNPAPATDLSDELLSVTSVIVPNEHEVALIGGVESLVTRGVPTVLVTRGAAGVEAFVAGRSPDGTVRSSHPALPVDPIDTTAAGDAFCGALAARLAAGTSLDEAIAWANVAGALATTRRGAIPSIPTAREIRERSVG